jgi:hypothetical protein
MSESFVLQKFLLLGALFAVTVTLLVTPVVVGVFRRKVRASMNRAAHGADCLDNAGARPATGGAASGAADTAARWCRRRACRSRARHLAGRAGPQQVAADRTAAR